MQIANYDQAGFTSANSIKFVRTNDTPSSRKDLTVTRKLSSYNPQTKLFSIPEYRMAVRRDTLDVDGRPTGQRLTFDLSIRTPIQASGDDFDEAFVDLQALLTDPEFKDSVLRQLFPGVDNAD